MVAITTVTFDLWQTLLLDNPEVGQVRAQARLMGARAALLKAGESFNPEQIEAAYRAGVGRCQQIREALLDVSFRQQVEFFVEAIRPGLSNAVSEATFQEIATAYSDSFFDYPPRPHPEGVAVLRGLQALGLKLGLISNTGMTPGVSFRRFLAEHGMLEYFAALTFSDEVGMAKPSPQIFSLTLDELGATPAEAVHVGDHIFNDVAAARKCGLKTVWIEGFSARPDPTDSAARPDITISDLKDTISAIQRFL